MILATTLDTWAALATIAGFIIVVFTIIWRVGRRVAKRVTTMIESLENNTTATDTLSGKVTDLGTRVSKLEQTVKNGHT